MRAGVVHAAACRAETHGLEGLSAEQQAAVRHVWNSHRPGDADSRRGGHRQNHDDETGPGEARCAGGAAGPLGGCSRAMLRKEGFADADTVAAFLGDKDMQASGQGRRHHLGR